MNEKKLIMLTLVTNGKKVIVPVDNIAFAIEIERESEQKEKPAFTRIFLRQVEMIEEEAKWVDVVEDLTKIMRKVSALSAKKPD